MVKYLAKRVLQGILLIIASSILIFSLLYLMPGNPIDSLVGEQVSEERKQEYMVEYGLDQPVHIQYINWVKNAIHGDFGISLKTKQEVTTVLGTRIPITLKICGIAMLVELIISVPIGLIMAYKKNSWFDKIIMGLTMVFNGMPSFWVAILLMYIFGVKLKLLPVTGFTSWKNYVLPITAIALGGCASTIRLTRSEVLNVIHEKYIATAYAKGLSKRRIMVAHVLRNALILIAVMSFLSLPWIIAGSVVIENIFGFPGVGVLLTNSIINQDFPVVQAIILIIAVLTVIANLLSDVVTAILDPRIKVSMSSVDN